jgi:hypothetical protein
MSPQTYSSKGQSVDKLVQAKSKLYDPKGNYIHCHGASNGLDIRLFQQNLPSFVTQTLDLSFCKLLAVAEMADPVILLLYVCHDDQ